MVSIIRLMLGASAGALVAAGPLAAQADPGAVKHRNDCRLAEQVLTHGQPANKLGWALNYISSCPGAADVLTGVWNSPPSEDAALQQLYYGSIHSKDPRMFAKAFEVAAEARFPAPVRLTALGTAVTYVRGDLVLYIEGRKRLEGLSPIEWDNVWGSLDHPLIEADEVPLPPGARDAVWALVTALREDESVDPLLRDSAYWLTTFFGLEG